ncbi:uncharacterized protein LOC115443766 isoform X1 [Manduca sexta]|uniref:uncharacterized protein LOC115443766 isoform X1 n=1 Tax=Manduca sexta TaxID=7130 RepID=UPI00188EE10F|nr:uncharacterized protein LOC115443766 isoform X1 [Manduca sexta]
MVNGNYVLYGDRPSSESEIVDDHVHTRTVDRKSKRKANRTANELQHTLNVAQLDNETDSIKYEKKVKEPRLLRYVPTTDVEENYVTEKFETYDLKPTEERPRRYAFTKKPKNPTDGSVNYAYSRSSSSCSSPNGNLPTISEHGEQFGTYRVHSLPSPVIGEMITGYETKLDKYFSKPREVKRFTAKGSHPDSLYRVSAGTGVGSGKMARTLRILRWPAALIVVCIALAVFIYFLMPDNMDGQLDAVNGTYWEPAAAGVRAQRGPDKPDRRPHENKKKIENTRLQSHGTKTSEIDFYDADTDKNYDLTSIIDTITETNPKRKLPIAPVFPSHITPEVQYGNEKADSEKLRTPKILEGTDVLPEDSTLKPHITQKPEKPLEIIFKDGAITTTTTETINRAETVNEFTNFEEKITTKKISEPLLKLHPSFYKDYSAPVPKGPQVVNIREDVIPLPDLPPEVQEFYIRRPVNVDANFTSGHSKLFGISIEDAEKMRSTTQSSLYNTRVSPTLPTWRDGDDTTTKKYPTNFNLEVPQCGSTRLALCRGVLPYDLAGAAANIGGVEVTSLMPQIEYLVATNCSDRARHFLCALLEPECNPPPYPPKMPCHNLCKAIIDSCDGLIPRELTPAFKCHQYSNNNCVAAKNPCYPRELGCGDGTCIPRDWICDGTRDCPAGEDEVGCITCEKNEYRCASGGCIQKRWLCDGYADCANGEDEEDDLCGSRGGHVVTGDRGGEPGEDAAGSAPAPAVRKPNRVPPPHQKYSDLRVLGENDSSKELLVTSDSSHPYKRNFTRRPSPSRLTPYIRRVPPPVETTPNYEAVTLNVENDKTEPKSYADKENIEQNESIEDVNIGDLGLFDDIKKEDQDNMVKRIAQKTSTAMRSKSMKETVASTTVEPTITRLDKTINKLERVINGAALLRKAVAQEKLEAAQDDIEDSPEKNNTSKGDDLPSGPRSGSISAHVSPCPSGELRCVDGRCITLAQLCDGTIDCSDHADEDNCYT